MKTGFSLVEAVVSVGVFAMIVLGIVALVPFIFQSANTQSALLSNNEQAMKVSFNLMKELRNAAPTITGVYPLESAANQQLIFYSDTGTRIDRINYFIQGGVLKKGIVQPVGTPPVYNLGTEVVTTIQKDLANGANPLFYYYDQNYNGVTDTPLVAPVNLTQVKFIKINLVIYNKGGRVGTNTYTVTAGGLIRNLKTNLGN